MELRYAQGISHRLETRVRAYDRFLLSIFFPGSHSLVPRLFENPHTPKKQIVGSGAAVPGVAGLGRIRLLSAGSRQTILGVIPCLGAGQSPIPRSEEHTY